MYRSITWLGDRLRLLDQRVLPHQTTYLEYTDYQAVAEAIRDMVVRGAPAIGAAAAYGLALAAHHRKSTNVAALKNELEDAARVLAASRPTAVNLFHAIDRVMNKALAFDGDDVEALAALIEAEAEAIAAEDVAINRAIGQHALPLIPENATIIHHCNTGALATVDYGTALGIIRAAHEAGKSPQVLVDETRPRLQGARLTAWELQQLGIPHRVIADSAAAFFMQREKVDLCVVGCDRVAANGDTANKIGTFMLALAARAHNIPFYVAAPSTTIDFNTPNGDAIEIEERAPEEITHVNGHRITPEGTRVANPAFDVTPAQYITAIITEHGIVEPPFDENLLRMIPYAQARG